MKSLSALKIVGFDWTIKRNADVATEGNIYGSTHHSSQTIFLDPDNTPQKDKQTLVHEVMHALWWQMGLGKRYKDDKMEEEIIGTLSAGLYQVLKDNKLSFHE